MQGGMFSYSTDYDYTAGNLVMHGGSLYLCIVANGPSSAVKYPTDAAYWRQLALTSQLPTVNNGTLTIQRNGSNVATFSANQAGNTTANLVISEIDSQSAPGGTGWVRFKSGIQIVFSVGTSGDVANFPVAFIADPRIEMTSPNALITGWYDRTTTSFRGRIFDPVNHVWLNGEYFDYIAIGFWK